jgi:hypothetical protein
VTVEEYRDATLAGLYLFRGVSHASMGARNRQVEVCRLIVGRMLVKMRAKKGTRRGGPGNVALVVVPT